MDKYKLIWSDRAFYDLEDAFELLSKKSMNSEAVSANASETTPRNFEDQIFNRQAMF
jgi:hypothetical protein